jgi:hypothetical protein
LQAVAGGVTNAVQQSWLTTFIGNDEGVTRSLVRGNPDGGGAMVLQRKLWGARLECRLW